MASVSDSQSVSNWKTLLLEAAFKQGPSFVISLILLAGLWNIAIYVAEDVVPQMNASIRQDYAEMQAKHDATVRLILANGESERIVLREALKDISQFTVEVRGFTHELREFCKVCKKE